MIRRIGIAGPVVICENELIMANTELQDIFNLIFKLFKLDCRSYNESYIQRRINARIMANNLQPNAYNSYAVHLASSPQEQRSLYDALTINVTQFFRDIKLWEALKRDAFPKIIDEKKRKSDNSLTVWSCGCSSGEEPYSIGITLKEVLKDKKTPVPLIIGTDIDEQSLDKSAKAIYDINVFKTMPQEYLLKYFKQVTVKDDIKYEVDPSVRAMARFVRNNFLLDPPPIRSADVIFCRNVIIYFTPAAKEKLMNVFYDTLPEHGWLVLGKSEVLFTAKMQQRFYLYNVEERIYRKERRKKQLKIDVERRNSWWPGYVKE